jgi:F420-0:gamma-glutamyl ligase
MREFVDHDDPTAESTTEFSIAAVTCMPEVRSGDDQVIITGSDGRVDKLGATQIAVGVHGIPPLRRGGEAEETLCDMIAAAAGIVMGQRDAGCPAALVRGVDYSFDADARITDALHPGRRS